MNALAGLMPRPPGHEASGREAMEGYGDFYRDRRVMITGGLGFIGSNLARRLVDIGARVLLVDSMIPDYGGNFHNIAGYEDRLRVNISDVRDENSLHHLVQG